MLTWLVALLPARDLATDPLPFCRETAVGIPNVGDGSHDFATDNEVFSLVSCVERRYGDADSD